MHSIILIKMNHFFAKNRNLERKKDAFCVLKILYLQGIILL